MSSAACTVNASLTELRNALTMYTDSVTLILRSIVLWLSVTVVLAIC